MTNAIPVGRANSCKPTAENCSARVSRRVALPHPSNPTQPAFKQRTESPHSVVSRQYAQRLLPPKTPNA